MSPTLKNGNIVLIQKYNLNLKNNDIIVIKKDNNIIIKRLIGIPNDTIRMDKYVYVNDKKFDEIIIEKNIGDISFEKTIKLTKDEYFVLGDNRQNSIDSRFEEIGIIKKDEIIGKVLFK